VLSLATLFVPAAIAQNTISARPGTLNYVEGQATLDGQALTQKSVGHAELAAGQVLETGNGKVEVLLTPGVFLRLGKDSSIRMISPDLTKTEIALESGRADVEVDQLYKQNVLLVDLRDGGSQTQLVKNGLYAFDAAAGTVRTFDGKALAFPTSSAEKGIEVKGGKEIVLNGEATKPHGFDKDRAQDDLYKWSSLRSEYLGESNERLASTYAGRSGFYPGWAWDPGLYAYTWMPGSGLFYNPFGFGFYSPAYMYGAGYYGGGLYGGGLYGGGFYRGGGYRGFVGGTGYHESPGFRGGAGFNGTGGHVGGGMVGGGGRGSFTGGHGFSGGGHR
jgi:hypothetical protein